MNRVSIKPENLPYLQALAQQMETDNISVAVNHLLMLLKHKNFSFYEGMTYISTYQKDNSTTPTKKPLTARIERGQPAFPKLDADDIPDENQAVGDEVIERFAQYFGGQD